ncbi:MAG: energy-coupled thiamine transporter ThiT [Acutalibacteraceae bacterium]|nr:energy-coupled thiamine transporter ThiT [Acutalibacteraceae bacterium]
MNTQKTNTKRMVLTALLISLATVLSIIKVIKMPLGGSVTLLSMLPIAMLSIEYGMKWGISSAFLYSLVQLCLDFGEVLSWGLTPIVLIGTIVFDYVLAYTALGISGAFRKKGVKGICIGIFIALLIRFISHFISGAILFASWCPEGWNIVLYSLCYNGAYMLPEMIFTMIGASVMFKLPQINKLMQGDKI